MGGLWLITFYQKLFGYHLPFTQRSLDRLSPLKKFNSMPICWANYYSWGCDLHQCIFHMRQYFYCNENTTMSIFVHKFIASQIRVCEVQFCRSNYAVHAQKYTRIITDVSLLWSILSFTALKHIGKLAENGYFSCVNTFMIKCERS